MYGERSRNPHLCHNSRLFVQREEYTLAAAIAHSRFVAAQSVSASMGHSHHDPLAAHQEGHAAWQQLRLSSEDSSDQAMGDVGAAALERNLAAYMYSVGRLGEGQPAGMGFGGHAQLAAMTSRAAVDDDGLSSEQADAAAASLPADACVSADAPCALQAAQEAVTLVPGGLHLVHSLDEQGEYAAPSQEHEPAAHMPSTNTQAWGCALALAHYSLRAVQYATRDTGVTLKQHTEAKKHSKQLLEVTAGTLKSVLGSMDDVQLAMAESDAAESDSSARGAQLLNVPPTTLHANDPQIAHTLHLLAITAVEQGNAVTAEGLYRAALDKYEAEAAAGRLHPYQARQWMYCANDYSSLLQKWDKRASEGEALLQDVAQRAVKHFAAMGVGDNRAAVSALPWLGEWRWTSADGLRV